MSAVVYQPSLLGVLRRHAQERPTARALIFLDAEGREQKVSTWADVYADAGRAARAWQSAGIRPGDVAVIVLDHSYDLVAAFLGAIYAGAAPLIMPPPRDNAQQAFSDHLVTLTKYTRARVVFSTGAVVSLVGDALAGLDCTVQMFTHAGAETAAPDFPFYRNAPTQPLYLQLTSGTTGMPKAAVLSQQATLTNIERVADARYRAGGPVVGCMPFHHDGGLVLCLLIPLVKGFPSVHIRPADWIVRPELLWQAVSAYRGTVTFLPNFALNFMVRCLAAHPQRTYDLSSLSTVIVAAELVMSESLQHFHQHFKSWGLQEEALCGAYGMAEQVVGVSFARRGQPTPIDWIDHSLLRAEKRAVAVEANAGQAHSVVSCGVPLAGIEVRVADAADAPLPERHIGEILLKTGHCFSGYYDRPDLTLRVMRDGWHCTGDLGYMAGGELYILGRKDDLLIIGGQNIQPQAIEEIATAVLGAQGRLAAAFSLRDENLGTQTAVLVCETRDEAPAAQLAAWRAAITRQVYAQLEITLADLRFVSKGWVVQMDAKIGRAASREKYLAAGYRPEAPGLALLRAAGDDPALLEQGLVQLVGQMLGASAVGPEDDFFALGGDSLTALRFVLAVEEATGRRVPTAFFRTATVARMAELLAPNRESPSTAVTDWESPAGSSPTCPGSVRSRLRIQATQIGPLWRGHGLPYGLGVHLQRLWVAQPTTRRRYARQLALVEHWAEELGSEGDGEARASISLLANTWVIWREYVLSHTKNLGRWWTMNAEHNAFGCSPPSTGIVLAVPHVAKVGAAVLEIFRRNGRAVGMVVGGREVGQKARAAMLLQGERILRRGGVVMVPADGLQGQQTVDVPFWGRRRPWQFGAAELTATTGAAFVPVYIRMDAKGKIDVEITAPLIPQATTPQAQISELTERYAADYAARWPHFYVSMRWHHLAYNWDRPAW